MKTPLPSILDDAPAGVRTEFQKHAIFRTLSSGEQLTLQGGSCHHFPLVHRGVIRVYTVGGNGQEVTLYRIQSGEGCVLTMTCMLRTSRFPAYAVVESDSEVFLIPSKIFRLWVDSFDFWREFALSYLTKTITNVVGLVEEIAFKNVGHRLIEFLLAKSLQSSSVIHLTHEEIARELGTAREVVSRTLKDLERQGLIMLGRRVITIRNAAGLASRARLL